MNKIGKIAVASVLTVSAIASPVMQNETYTEAAIKVKLNITKCTMNVGDKFKLKLSGAKAESFRSSDRKVAKVTKKGNVTAKKAGKAVIYVTDTDGNTYNCRITVKGDETENKNDKKDDKKDDKIKDTSGNTIDLGGMTIYIRDWWSPGTMEDPTAELPLLTEYEKKQKEYQQEMMKKYNFTIYEVGIDGWGDTIDEFEGYVLSGGDDTNYIWTLNTDSSLYNFMRDGYMADLSKMDCLDFSEIKFQRNRLHEKYSVGSSIYAFYSGYSEPRTGVYFNKTILREAGIDPDSIYEAQLNGTWDWDMFEELMRKCQDNGAYGLCCNNPVMTSAAVVSNNTTFIGKLDGKIVNNIESEATKQSLNWCVDMFHEFNNRPTYTEIDPVTGKEKEFNREWDTYKSEWIEGKVAFLVEDYYANTQGDVFGDIKDFEIGYVMFPKGPNADKYVSIFDNNAYVIPACYVGQDIDKDGHDRAWRIACAWNAYTNPVPGYEDYNIFLDVAANGNFDERALKETLPMMCLPNSGVLVYEDIITGIDMGPDILWDINDETESVDDVIAKIRKKWNKAVKNANK